MFANMMARQGVELFRGNFKLGVNKVNTKKNNIIKINEKHDYSRNLDWEKFSELKNKF